MCVAKITHKREMKKTSLQKNPDLPIVVEIHLQLFDVQMAFL